MLNLKKCNKAEKKGSKKEVKKRGLTIEIAGGDISSARR